MLKILLIVGLTVVGLFLLACLLVGGLMLILVLTTPKEDVLAPFRRSASSITPTQDDMLFSRLAREAMAYATRPYVSTVIHVEGDALVNTISDAFRRRVYVESRRRVSKTLLAVICVYKDGSEDPEAEVSMEIPATQVDWPAHFSAISDIAAHGPWMSFTDHSGRRREVRIPKHRRHHA
jgi:hypothetical protein